VGRVHLKKTEHRDGTSAEVEDSAFPGTLLGFQCWSYDKTKKVGMRKANMNREREYRHLADNMFRRASEMKGLA